MNYQKKKNCKKYKHMEIKKHATKQRMDHLKKIKQYIETNENTMIQKPMGCSKSSSKREI